MIIKGVYLLAGLDQSNNLALAKFASTYYGTQPLEVLSGVLVGVGVASDGTKKILKLSGSGQWLS